MQFNLTNGDSIIKVIGVGGGGSNAALLAWTSLSVTQMSNRWN
jgi:hypothetical protein